MEIKRVADHFIIDLHQKRIAIYWNRKFKFGENIIRRMCERITTNELDQLVEAIDLMNTALRTKKNLTEEEGKKIDTVNRAVTRIFAMQISAWMESCDVNLLKEFIDACYSPLYKNGYVYMKEQFEKRFEGIETETERNLLTCSCMEDCLLTRSFITKGLINDFASLFRFCLINDSKKIISNVAAHPTVEISFLSFALQLFMDHPTYKDFDKRSFDGVVPSKLRAHLADQLCKTELLEEMAPFLPVIKNGRNLSSNEYLDQIYVMLKIFRKNNPECNPDSLKQIIDTISAVEMLANCYPKPSLVDDNAWYRKSDEERRNIALKFFEAWDTEMPDDIAYMKRAVDLNAKIEAEKKARVDAEDIAAIGKTKDQLKEEAGEEQELKMVLKDENGNEISESAVCAVPK